ncbi:unnamed protein product [Didymodactylos carnosus]|uniref:Major facilitator superfamily (MFS) profile domain-containing protein n=1 Tax=Didymodactylos carnosus TaxID=1234261 RepID=A0A813Z872_9BILA|nr:unnamed protein product [Didymodactylos carnosus]CAF3678295.1 unnamed protein product [Didymodactylos carnosus]
MDNTVVHIDDVNQKTIVHEHELSDQQQSKLIRKLVWKIDIHLIPFLALLYLCSFLDRINIGNAKLAGIENDLHLTPSQYNVVLSIFFVGYVLFEVPSNLLLKLLGTSIWLPIIMIIWGIIMMSMAAVKNYPGLLACRLFLGVAEAGLFPGVVFYLSLWYTRREQTLRLGLFFSAAVLAGSFGGVLAFGITKLHNRENLKGWQWIFILEGIPAILLGIISYFYLPYSIETVKWLSDSERQALNKHLKQGTNTTAIQKHFSWSEVKEAFIDKNVYIFMFAYIGNVTPFYSLSLFFPSIIHGMKFSNLTAQAMSAPPYAVACVLTICIAAHSGYRNERCFHIMGCSLLGIIGYILLLTFPKYGQQAMYAASIIACAGTFSSIPPLLAWFTSNIGGSTKKAVAVAMIVGFGNLGGVFAGQHPDFRYVT